MLAEQAPAYQIKPIINRSHVLHLPRIFHIVWIGPAPFPYEKYLLTWKRHNPEWQVMFWNDKNLPKLYNQYWYDRMPEYAYKCDLLRLELLYKYGGVYSDADSFCARPVEFILLGTKAFAHTRRISAGLENGTMGCMPEDRYFGRLVHEFNDHALSMRKQSVSPFDLCGRNYIYSVVKDCYYFKYISRSLIGPHGSHIRHGVTLSWNNGNWEKGLVNYINMEVEDEIHGDRCASR